LPTEHDRLRAYANKARADWIPATANWPGVVEMTTYRNPLEHSPQALTVITFHSMTAWQEFVSSRTYQRMMHEVRALGCTMVNTHVWIPSSLTPEPVHAGFDAAPSPTP
jgi:hypothetical protein